MSVQQIDQGLAEYYKSFGRTDYVSNGIGLFMQYCEENGFDDSEIIEELECDVSDSCLTEFDPQFPLISAIPDPIERNEQIMRVIKYCHLLPFDIDHNSDNTISTNKYKIKANGKNFHIWNIRVHVNDISDLYHFNKFNSCSKYVYALLIINGYIRDSKISNIQNDIICIIVTYYDPMDESEFKRINKVNQSISLLRSLIMSILCLLQSDYVFNPMHNRITSKRYEQAIERIKSPLHMHTVHKVTFGMHGKNVGKKVDINQTVSNLSEWISTRHTKTNDECKQDIESFESEIAHKMDDEINKYRWIDIINESFHDANDICNFQIDLYENDFNLTDFQKLFKNNETIVNIKTSKSMLSMKRCLSDNHGLLYQLKGPLPNLDNLNENDLQLKKRLLELDDGKLLYNMVSEWYCCHQQKNTSWVIKFADNDVRDVDMYFGLLHNTFHFSAADSILSASFLVHRNALDKWKTLMKFLWPLI